MTHTPVAGPHNPAAAADAAHASLLEVARLYVRFGSAAVVEDLSFALAAGESLGIVGESGSGKSQAALAILGLSPPAARVEGSVRYDGQELLRLRRSRLNRLRGVQIASVFQNPVACLNPHLRIGVQMAEMLEVHRGATRSAALAECRRLLDAVQLADPQRRLRQYPHELSGGQCQRIAIAMALSCDPRLLIADEPTTALDATVQAQLLDLLAALRRERGLSLLLISHDLGVVAELCTRVLVMREGRLLESGSVDAILRQPRHPYTAELVAASSLSAG